MVKFTTVSFKDTRESIMPTADVYASAKWGTEFARKLPTLTTERRTRFDRAVRDQAELQGLHSAAESVIEYASKAGVMMTMDEARAHVRKLYKTQLPALAV